MTANAGTSRLEVQGRSIYWRLMLTGALSVAKLLITSAGDVKRFRRPSSSEERYVRPERLYELPPYSDSMRVTRSRERCLRPTRYCNPRAPEVVAVAHSLGAFQKPDFEYAEAAFEFAKERMTLEIAPIDSAEASLRRGTGTCFDLITVFIALCRAAGIPARYKIYSTGMIQAWEDSVINVDPLLKKWFNALGYFLMEGEGEAYVEGAWRVAHVGPRAERQAAAGIPITRFGEDSLGIWFFAQPGTIMRLESLPLGLAAGSRALHAISPGSMERVNISVLKQIEKGREILAQAGGVRAYDEHVRRTKEPPSQQEAQS
jgi:hypothetical protein